MQPTIEIVSVPIIAILCGGIAQYIKRFNNEKLNKRIPMIMPPLGAIFALACMYWFPQYIVADNPLIAIILGAFTGWASTGAYESGKKYKELKEESDAETH